ncbi:Ankyrin repeat domain-containing protein 44 [Xylographa trunciseda]|nr:Ankyrin repeat domain-containing protein 44 [Xylographa trunciseda]
MLINDVKHPLSPLHRAVANDHLEAIQTLLVYASSELEFSDSLFQLVVEPGRIDFFDLLISRTKITTNEDRSAMLRHAIKNGSIKRTIEFIDPVSVYAKDNVGNSPLHLAIDQRNISICKLLLESGADPNQANDRGGTPLHVACNNSDSSVVKLLIQHGASVNRENRDGRHAIHLAAAAGHTETLNILLAAGANIFATDDKDETALHCSAKVGAEAIVKILLIHGTEINALDERGRTPLHYAIQSNNASSLGIMYLLIEAGASISTTDNEGMTPLHLAASQGADRLVVELLSLGADIHAVNRKGRSASDCARANGHDSVAKLIPHSADEIRDECQWSDTESY